MAPRSTFLLVVLAGCVGRDGFVLEGTRSGDFDGDSGPGPGDSGAGPGDSGPLPSGIWTWVGGSEIPSTTSSCPVGPRGVYPSPPADDPPTDALRPGARDSAGFVVTPQGPVLYGGFGCGGGTYPSGTVTWLGFNSDMWLYDWTGGAWSWLGGTNQPNDNPIGWASNKEGAPLVRAADGRLFMFGGRTQGGSVQWTNELWAYDSGASSWTRLWGSDLFDGVEPNHVSLGSFDPASAPGAREEPALWAALDGTLWVYGGGGICRDAGGDLDNGGLNDTWRYDARPASGTVGQWAWMAGSDRKNSSPTATNPGAVGLTSFWTGSDGHLYLFGGNTYQPNYYSSVWRFCLSETSPCGAGSLHTWSRIAGSGTANAHGVYGVRGEAAPANEPGGRSAAALWVDAAGAVWVFGGFGYGESGAVGHLNDLWRFDGQGWAWMGGSKNVDDVGAHGVLGVGASTNLPPARSRAQVVSGPGGSALLYGGNTDDARWADLWRFEP